jgi:hypothetical protein
VARPPVVREMEPPAHPQVEDFETAFSEPELDSIHAQDVHGGGRIVGLLLGIFGFGLLMYSAIFFWVLSTIKD